MVWADAVVFVMFFIRNIALTTFTIPTFIAVLVNMVAKFLPNFLATTHMIWVSCTHIIRIFYAKFANEILETFCVLIDIFLYRQTRFACLLKDFATVFVSTSLKTNISAAHYHISPQHIGQDIVHNVAQMWIAVDIWDCCGDIVFFHTKYYIILIPWRPPYTLASYRLISVSSFFQSSIES